MDGEQLHEELWTLLNLSLLHLNESQKIVHVVKDVNLVLRDAEPRGTNK